MLLLPLVTPAHSLTPKTLGILVEPSQLRAFDDWSVIGMAPDYTIIPLVFAVRQQSVERLHEVAHAVAWPDSPVQNTAGT